MVVISGVGGVGFLGKIADGKKGIHAYFESLRAVFGTPAWPEIGWFGGWLWDMAFRGCYGRYCPDPDSNRDGRAENPLSCH